MPPLQRLLNHGRTLAAAIALFLPLSALPAWADTASDQAAIRATLDAWTQAFNERRGEIVCDLFTNDMRFDYQGAGERGYAELCGQLRRTLANEQKRFHYSAAIKEIIIEGDLAVVRLVWTMKVTPVGGSEGPGSPETGLDVFRRQPDGSWKIIRYIAYDG